MATNIESSRSPVNNYDQQEKSAFQFLTMCVVLAAMIFGLIYAVTYFTNSTARVPPIHRRLHHLSIPRPLSWRGSCA